MDKLNLSVEYRITRKIADGGMGSVYEAVQCGAVGFEKRVAIKVLLPEYAERKELLQMFIHEAKLVATLVHENIVQLYHLGFHAERYMMIMEYIKGYSLDQFIEHHRKEKKKIPQELAVFIASRIARGLAYAHTRPDAGEEFLSVVHRDVSPKNILITSEGVPKVADFGLALVVQGESSKVVQDYLSGRLPYMAPEQARGEAVDFTADIYGLGAVLFEMLTLEPLRVAENQFHQLKQAVDGEVRWQMLKADNRLLSIVKRCLALTPESRYPETSALAEDLERYIYEGGYGPTIASLKAYALTLELQTS
jgi:serine/threonine protein kinase